MTGRRSRRERSHKPSAPIVWSDRARSDLREIDEYVSADDPIAAERWVDRLIRAVERAAVFPRAGRVVPELRHEAIREVFVRTYRIVYRLRSEGIEVVTVFEGHRRLPGGGETD